MRSGGRNAIGAQSRCQLENAGHGTGKAGFFLCPSPELNKIFILFNYA